MQGLGHCVVLLHQKNKQTISMYCTFHHQKIWKKLVCSTSWKIRKFQWTIFSIKYNKTSLYSNLSKNSHPNAQTDNWCTKCKNSHTVLCQKNLVQYRVKNGKVTIPYFIQQSTAKHVYFEPYIEQSTFHRKPCPHKSLNMCKNADAFRVTSLLQFACVIFSLCQFCQTLQQIKES